ncbi:MULTISPECIES: META domain-containing protein [Marinobacter]|uniref:META domain-containing protein n=1 Tax=Marinobacter TaxID=2742 RepID=UPI000DACB71E|nr:MULTISPECIES: META domain-containing protein [Marinobacter]
MMKAAPYLRVLLLLLAGCVMSACTTVPAEEEAAEAEITFTNTFWRLAHVGGEKVAAENGVNAPYIVFLDDGRVNGFAGCNDFRGRYGTFEGQFRFVEMAATRKICPGEPVEPAFMKAMRQTVAVDIKDDELLLLNTEGQPLAVFKAMKKRFQSAL